MEEYFKLTRYGRKVTNVDNLNTLVYGVNKHSSVKQISSDKDMDNMETLKLPVFQSMRILQLLTFQVSIAMMITSQLNMHQS